MADHSAGTNGMTRRRRPAGYTLIEVMTVVAIIAIVAALAFSTYFKAKPRTDLSTYGVEVEQAIRNARSAALSRGRDVSVLFYGLAATTEGVGRVIVFVDDTTGAFMGGGAPPNFCTFDPLTASAGVSVDRTEILVALSLPRGIMLSAPAQVVPVSYPFNTVPWPANGCSFCTPGTGVGGIRFDSKGRAAFYSACGLAGNFPNGGSVAVTSSDLGSSVVIMVTPFGIVRSFHVG